MISIRSLETGSALDFDGPILLGTETNQARMNLSVEFEYKAVTASGKAAQGTMAGETKQAVALALQRQGLVPLSINLPGKASTLALKSGASKRPLFRLDAKRDHLPFWGRPKPKDLIMFAENLAVILRAGIPLNRGLNVLSELAENKRFREVIGKVAANIREGSSLWQALQSQGSVFPPVFISMIRAGETGSVLDTVLARLAEYLTGIQELKDYLVSAMIYPVILAFTAIGSVAVMLTLVVPKFAQIFQDIGVEMPLATQLMLTVGDFFQKYWLVLMLVCIGSGAGFRWAVGTTTGRYRWDLFKLRLPLLGSVFRKIEIARFARTFGTLLGSGLSILPALNIVKGVVVNQVMRSQLDMVYEDLKQGKMLSVSLERHDVFPPLAVHMLAVGEETGQLDAMMSKVGEIYDTELKSSIKSFTALFEPIVILFMGLLIGAMVVSMLLAIFSINELGF